MSTSGSILYKASGISRLSESGSDGYVDLFHEKLIRDLGSLLEDYTADALAGFLFRSSQAWLQDDYDFLGFDQSSLDSIRAVESRANPEDEFWTVLGSLPEALSSWTPEDHFYFFENVIGEPGSYAFNLKAQVLAGAFFEFSKPNDTIPAESDWSLRLATDEYSLIVDFDLEVVTVSYDGSLELTFDEIRAGNVDLTPIFS